MKKNHNKKLSWATNKMKLHTQIFMIIYSPVITKAWASLVFDKWVPPQNSIELPIQSDFVGSERRSWTCERMWRNKETLGGDLISHLGKKSKKHDWRRGEGDTKVEWERQRVREKERKSAKKRTIEWICGILISRKTSRSWCLIRGIGLSQKKRWVREFIELSWKINILH